MKSIIPVLLVALVMTLAADTVTAVPSCPSSWPSPILDDGIGAYGPSYDGFFTDSEGQQWFIVLSTDSNGYTIGRAYRADDRYEAGYAGGEAGLAILYRQGEPVQEPECWQFEPSDDEEPPAATGVVGPIPPIAGQRPYSFTHHGITVDDPWHWLQDEDYPTVDDEDVLAYLEAENDYFDAIMEPQQNLVDTIFEEIGGRQPAELTGLPQKGGDWYYQWRYGEGSQYRQWLRWPASDPNAREGPTDNAEIFLDEVALAEGLEYFRLGSLSISNDGSLAAYSTDTKGAERYTLVVKDLGTGELLVDEITGIRGSAIWSPDDSSFFYTPLDEVGRTYEVRRHDLGEPVGDDTVVYEETDPGFFVGVGATSSDQYVIIAAGDHVTSEYRLLAADDPTAQPVLVAPRRAGHDYSIDHQGDRFVIRTNDNHQNFRIATAPEDDPTEAGWETLLQGSESLYILGFYLTEDYIAVEERIDGLDQVRIIDRTGQSTHVEFPEEAYTAYIHFRPEFDVNTLRVVYSSMTTPWTHFDYHIDTGELELRRVQEIPSGYDASEFVTHRILAPARDGEQVPVSIVRHRDTPVDGSAPLYIYGYGAYGYAITPYFSSARLSLLDRGFVFAIAHVRGGDDLGFHWYESGKLFQRTNTFNDFVDVARHLIDQGYGAEGRIAISGASAGGTLMGAVVNQAPELWGVMVAQVPFVDVLNTMLNADLPLTPPEWPEWGNPIEDKAAFEYIRSYSPYDQLIPGEYPPIMVTAGLNDPRVTYWEPAKYVAKLRAVKTDDNLVLLKTDMGSGHGGRSGRTAQWYEIAEEYAFMLASLGLVE